MNIDSFFTKAGRHVPDKTVRSFGRWKARRRWRLLVYLRKLDKEAKVVVNDPNAPTCTDPDKIKDFLPS